MKRKLVVWALGSAADLSAYDNIAGAQMWKNNEQAGVAPRRITLALNHLVDGGAARVASHLACAWTQMGRSVTILTTDDGSRPALYELHPLVQHRPLALFGDSKNAFQAVYNNCWRLAKLRRAICASRPDVVVSFLDTTNVMCILATRRLQGLPIIVSERLDPNGLSIKFAWRTLRRLTYPMADCLVLQSRQVMAYFPPAIRAKSAVIPNPVVLLAGARSRPSSERFQIVTLGRLQKTKGHDLLIDAFARVAADFPAWDLVIYGEGPQRGTLEGQIRALGLEARVVLAGNTTEVGARLREADLYVLSSLVEGFPNALAEAMACGLPVISFDCASGPSELIRDGVDGLLVPPASVDGLVYAMRRLMEDPDERARLASRAPEVLERFSLERILGLWETALQNVCRAAR